MKIKTLLTTFSLITCCLLQFGCNRSAGDTWENTKTAGRQINKGFRTLSGNNNESRLFRNSSQFDGPPEPQYASNQQYIPLNDPEVSRQLHIEGHVPQASQTPGDTGSSLPGIDGFSEPSTNEQVHVFQHVHFDTNDHIIRGDENKQIVRTIAGYLKQHPNINLFIEGHCDKRGPAAYNLALGARRSNSVRNMLVKEGVDSEKLFTISYGKERPIALGDDSESLQVNRRAQFKLYQN